MTYLLGIGLIILLVFGLVALFYRGKAKAEQHHAELQQRRALAAEDYVNQRHRLDSALTTLHEVHREETIHDTNPAHLAARSDFDNDWSAATGLHASGTVTHPDRGSAAAAGQAGAAVDNVSRTDLSE